MTTVKDIFMWALVFIVPIMLIPLIGGELVALIVLSALAVYAFSGD